MISKLSIGSAQFGLDYGISNKRGQVSLNDVEGILQYAYTNGIKHIDTAQAYGNSEEVLGKTMKELDFLITTKVSPANLSSVVESVNESLIKLERKKVYSLLYHDFNSFLENKDSINEVYDLKRSGKVETFGFSLYYPEELEWLLENKLDFDVIQFPFNIYDQRFKPYFRVLKDKNVDIQVRSVFLQGLFFIQPSKLHPFFEKIFDKQDSLYKYSKEVNISIHELCLAFVNGNMEVDQIVLGIDSLDNLKQNVNINYNLVLESIVDDYFDSFSINDEEIIIPSKWKI
jgi:uncharacterized protein